MGQPAEQRAEAEEEESGQRLERSRLRTHLPAALILLCMAGFLVFGARSDDPTVDEPRHFARGLAHWWYGDARLSISHPPLANTLQALPAAFSEPLVPEDKVGGWSDKWNLDRTVTSFMRKDYPAFRAWLLAGRLVTACMSLLLALYVYVSLLPAGLTLARMSLFFLAFAPVFLAQGRLVTTDLALTAAVALTVGETYRFLRTRRRWPLFTASLALGLAFAVKYSGLFLVPPLVFSMGIAAWRGCERFDRALPLRRRLLQAFGVLAAMAVISILVLNASYRFQRTGWTVEEILSHPEPTNGILNPYKGEALESLSILPMLPASLRIPLPYSYIVGLHVIKGQNLRGHGGWFFGKRRGGQGSPFYVPVMLAIKSPASMILAFLLAAGLFFRRFKVPWGPATIVWAVPLTYLAFGLGSRIKIGVRHSMPILFFLILAAAWGAAWLWERGGRARAICGALLVLLAAETTWSAPNMISHFSWLIGGPSVGHRISIIGESWGQDLEELAAFSKEEGGTLYFLSYGIGSLPELRYHGVNARRFTCKTKELQGPGWVAINAARALRQKPPCGPLQVDRPDRVLFDHYFLYRIPAGGLRVEGDVGGVR